ncbi:zinc ribbon domain-containing protein [Clostridium folliculivorans]|uniref:Zinc-ribbon 15 domain-containing protein n=1 Tax=Clostridium folliculivorans TaxID=2886038 RepID=A0A9W6DA60_9CLOT|nr:zinc ribbon domain-containing protein [Clostridium folliculivorans]GKU25035.1 hypothetical protein CFOLD11_18610 [Clostridium folliculivorans]GKU31133.1 hypothetical protein CFB3_32400 [Clostridium folliculivorans]
MIIWGWGKVTRKFIGGVFERTCNYCNQTNVWRLCIATTWFTLFFIPIIPYKKKYQIACPSCGSYVELTREQFEKLKVEMQDAASGKAVIETIDESLKYSGKTETQINYLKQMEEYNKMKADSE